jgi:hypothetical protein
VIWFVYALSLFFFGCVSCVYLYSLNLAPCPRYESQPNENYNFVVFSSRVLHRKAFCSTCRELIQTKKKTFSPKTLSINLHNCCCGPLLHQQQTTPHRKRLSFSSNLHFYASTSRIQFRNDMQAKQGIY